MTTTIEILKAARDLIAKPENWTQVDYHIIRRGNHCYCALGALAHVQDIIPGDDVPGASYLARAATRGVSSDGFYVARWNDEHSHEEVLALFSKAIEAAEKETV
jgi:hypothetical protein